MPPWRSRRYQALYYKAGKDQLLIIVLTSNLEGKRPDQMFYCTKLDWTPRQILSAYACRWAIECTFENCKQFLGLEDPANRLPRPLRDRAMALFIYSLVVVWFHKSGHQLLRFSLPTLVPEEGRAIVCRHVDDPEAGQLRGEIAATASKTVWPENLMAHSPTSQPNRVSDTSARRSRPPAPLHDRFAGGNFTPLGRSRTALESAKLELSG